MPPFLRRSIPWYSLPAYSVPRYSLPFGGTIVTGSTYMVFQYSTGVYAGKFFGVVMT